jgi:hypothetical protein
MQSAQGHSVARHAGLPQQIGQFTAGRKRHQRFKPTPVKMMKQVQKAPFRAAHAGNMIDVQDAAGGHVVSVRHRFHNVMV